MAAMWGRDARRATNQKTSDEELAVFSPKGWWLGSEG